MGFLTGRGIGRATLSRWPVVSASVPVGGSKQEAVVFNYIRDGDRVNWKARAIAEKEFTQQPGGEQRFWNLDRVLQGPMDAVFITEGEVDALSLAEVGIPDNSILSVPGGAPSGEGDQDPKEMRRYEHVLKALGDGLAKATRFVLCVDNDEPGRRLKRDLVALLGPAKCWHVEWPDGVKDANEALVKWGAEDLRIYLTEAQKEWPVVGLYSLDDLPEPPERELWEPGFPEWESRVRISPTMLSVFTGFPQHGKTVFSQQLWFNIAKKHNIRVALMSAETPAKPDVRENLRQFHSGVLQHRMTPEEIVAADQWIREHFKFIAHPNSRPTFGWLVEMIEAAAQRYGCRAAVIDPWNKLESEFDPRGKSETQWIGECLDELLDAARALDMHIQILAHPSKPDHVARGRAPDLYSISGSAHWANRVDQGFVIYRPKIVSDDGVRQTGADFYQQKVRFRELGYPCKLHMQLDLTTGRYESVDYKTGPV